MERWHLGLVGILGVALYAGLGGIDFGHHWDEQSFVRVVSSAARRGELLPQAYAYPSVGYDLILSSAAGTFFSRCLWPAIRGVPEHVPELAAILDGKEFLLQTRVVFFLCSMLGVVWTYLTLWTSTRSRLQATFGAAALGFSWQLGYHARFIAPDAVMASLGALATFCMQKALARSSSRWLWAGAAAAGLACSTKYPGGALLLPLLLCAGLVGRSARGVRRAATVVRHLAGAVAVFSAAYLVATPGTLLDYRRFFNDLWAEYAHYHQVGHPGGHSIAAGAVHLRAALEYLACAALSPHVPIAVALAILALVGAIATLRAEGLRALVVLSFPVVYVAFMSRQAVFVARNLLIVLPFLALFAGRGASSMARAASRLRGGREMVGLALAGLVGVNAVSLVRAGRSVARDDDPLTAVAAYVADHPGTRFAVTPTLETALERKLGALPPNVVGRERPDVEVALFWASDAITDKGLEAYHHDFALACFGSREIDYNYYPTWAGRPHVIAMKPARARAIHMLP